MNTAPLIFGLLAAFALIGVLAGVLAARWRPGHDRGLTRSILVGLAGAYAGGLLFTLAPLDVESGLIGAPLAAAVSAVTALIADGGSRAGRSKTARGDTGFPAGFTEAGSMDDHDDTAQRFP